MLQISYRKIAITKKTLKFFNVSWNFPQNFNRNLENFRISCGGNSTIKPNLLRYSVNNYFSGKIITYRKTYWISLN